MALAACLGPRLGAHDVSWIVRSYIEFYFHPKGVTAADYMLPPPLPPDR
jgi:hypothetical protein